MEETIGARLRAWRHALGLTQARLADRLGVHIGVLKKYEQGVNVPGGEFLASIAKTGVNVTWLLTGDGPMCTKTSDDSMTYESPHARRWEKIIALVEGIEDEQKRAAVLDELFSHAQEKAELAAAQRELQALRQAVADLQKRTA